MLAFHTDADLAAAKETAAAAALLQRARTQPGLRSLLDVTDFEARGEGGHCAAHSSSIGEVAGAGWIAVGDAALACDPLSSQGLFNALYSAFPAVGAVRLSLMGDMSGLSDYQLAIDRVTRAYRTHLTAWYALETRWQDRPFWPASSFGRTLVLHFRSSCVISAMSTSDGHTRYHPSRHKPSFSGQRLVPQDGDRERGNDGIYGIARLARRCESFALERRALPAAFASRKADRCSGNSSRQ